MKLPVFSPSFSLFARLGSRIGGKAGGMGVFFNEVATKSRVAFEGARGKAAARRGVEKVWVFLGLVP